jgi:hypothetical protein
MNQELENYYLKQPEPIQGCLLALKSIILSVDKEITHRRLYQIPVFYYKEKRLAYLWVQRKRLLFGIITDKSILTFPEGSRPKDQYERMEIQPNDDIPIDEIIARIGAQLDLYR